MRKVVIYGSSGSGKSRLAGSIASLLQVPHVEIDLLAYDEHGKHVEQAVLASRFRAALDDGGWVVEGMHRDQLIAAIPDAEAFIWLDVPRWRVGWQLLRRTATHWIARNPRHGRHTTVHTMRKRELPFIAKTLRKHAARRAHGHHLAQLARD